jgi:hypothetical protein
VIKISLVVVLLFLLFVPLLQSFTAFRKKIEPLHGTFYPEPDITFSWKGWFDGAYQAQKEKFVRDSFGLHNYYIRLYSEVRYQLFGKSTAAFVVSGEDKYLYEIDYIKAYYGRDFIGAKKINDYIEKLKCVQDTLRKKNKLLLVALAPGKASYYPEYIPRKYHGSPAVSNYLYFREALKAKKLDHIDYNRHFVEQKHKSPYPLYPQYGIHWSSYGSIMAFDSLTRYIESKLNTDVPDLKIRGIELSDSLRNTDDDIIKGMNLLLERKSFPMAYMDYEVVYDSTKHKKPSLLVIADSFWWYIYSTSIPAATFSNHEFWFYNEAMYPQSFTSQVLVSETDYFARIRAFDVIVLLYTEATLARFGDGFVQMAYETYCKQTEFRQKLQNMKASIAATKEWYREIIRKAGERGISVDSMLTLDAIYVMGHPPEK